METITSLAFDMQALGRADRCRFQRVISAPWSGNLLSALSFLCLCGSLVCLSLWFCNRHENDIIKFFCVVQHTESLLIVRGTCFGQNISFLLHNCVPTDLLIVSHEYMFCCWLHSCLLFFVNLIQQLVIFSLHFLFHEIRSVLFSSIFYVHSSFQFLFQYKSCKPLLVSGKNEGKVEPNCSYWMVRNEMTEQRVTEPFNSYFLSAFSIKKDNLKTRWGKNKCGYWDGGPIGGTVSDFFNFLQASGQPNHIPEFFESGQMLMENDFHSFYGTIGNSSNAWN